MTGWQPGGRVLVCGGRNFHLRPRVDQALDRLAPSMVIHGGAAGADRLAHEWARAKGVEIVVYHPAWGKMGTVAGAWRNKRMLTHGKPDLVMAFPGGSGTNNMVSQARQHGVQVWEPMRRELEALELQTPLFRGTT